MPQDPNKDAVIRKNVREGVRDEFAPVNYGKIIGDFRNKLMPPSEPEEAPAPAQGLQPPPPQTPEDHMYQMQQKADAARDAHKAEHGVDDNGMPVAQ